MTVNPHLVIAKHATKFKLLIVSLTTSDRINARVPVNLTQNHKGVASTHFHCGTSSKHEMITQPYLIAYFSFKEINVSHRYNIRNKSD